MEKIYLGDGVYVEASQEKQIITLTTENGIEITNTIIFEPEVLFNLVRFLRGLNFKL